ncbi:helix-turn-helix domain-containing protein [Streptomyces sp. SL13]|uniref:Helix-turn-helix domain-containing protein n=1 Tax=Streptantibioticus silvisoli TaxID=2705255 RepID=A0AA90H8A6_9ACTN|nr:helix-turn-helix domain-containing protein [Streptantibioticus silvisoli]MDI5973746.1 helix-turn-helix domain-containing protein [Streptantibioticus silvisoli]
MRQPPQEDSLDAQVERLGARMLERAERIADTLVTRIRAAVPVYRTEAAVSGEELRRTCLDNVTYVFGPLGRAPALSSPESRENGRRRAHAGVPLTAVMEAYRVSARFLWDCLAEEAARGGVPAEVTVRAASEMWLVLDTYTQQMAEGYREELTAQALGREQRRSALVTALLEGRPEGTDGWDAAAVLRIPPRGPYVAVAARVPGPGRHAVRGAAEALRAIGAGSAWHLLHDIEVGIVQLPDPARNLERLAAVTASSTAGRAGISPPYDDLLNTAAALRLARIALLGSFEGGRVTVFDRDPLAVAAASAPEITGRVAHAVLAGLDRLPPVQRALLLETFGVWLDSGGSADRAANALFCHPNTVRHRLRRLEEHTGRSLGAPRAVAELALAFEIDRRVTPERPSAQQG